MEWDVSVGLSNALIDNMDKNELDILINPATVGIHRTSRVLIFDRIEMLLTIFTPDVMTMERTKNCKMMKECRRYSFHGGDKGRFDGYFNKGDKWVFVTRSGKETEINSIPSWNLAHFFCDYFNTTEKTRELEDWLFDNEPRINTLKRLLKGEA